MENFKINLSWKMEGTVIIQAETLQEAEEKVRKNNIPPMANDYTMTIDTSNPDHGQTVTDDKVPFNAMGYATDNSTPCKEDVINHIEMLAFNADSNVAAYNDGEISDLTYEQKNYMLDHDINFFAELLSTLTNDPAKTKERTLTWYSVYSETDLNYLEEVLNMSDEEFDNEFSNK